MYAYNDPSATDITLTQTGGAVSGQNYGIYGNNQGTGSTVIGVAGDVTATEGIGVAGYNGGLAQDIRINQTTGTITGHEFGMVADNGGTGSIQITSSGRVSGGSYGIYASQAGAGPTAIAIHGDVNGDAGAGILSVSGSDVTIDIAPPIAMTVSSMPKAMTPSPGPAEPSPAGSTARTAPTPPR